LTKTRKALFNSQPANSALKTIITALESFKTQSNQPRWINRGDSNRVRTIKRDHKRQENENGDRVKKRVVKSRTTKKGWNAIKESKAANAE